MKKSMPRRMHDDLLRQARELAEIDSGRPKQANLRRSVSAAYYGVFHFLVDQSCRRAIGSRNHQSAFRHVLGRAFVHTAMKDACRSFAGGTLKDSIKKGLPPRFSIPSEIGDLAATFVELQNKRHQADYDLTEGFRRHDVLALIQQVETAIRRFENVGNSDEKKFFLACLWAWKTLAGR